MLDFQHSQKCHNNFWFLCNWCAMEQVAICCTTNCQTASNLWHTKTHKQQDLSLTKEYFVSGVPVQLKKGIITPELFLWWYIDSFLPVVIIQLKQFSWCLVHLLNVEMRIKTFWKALSFCAFTQFMHGYDVKSYLASNWATQSSLTSVYNTTVN